MNGKSNVVVEFEELTFRYRSQESPTLKNINLQIHEGERIVIVGPSGSGKSTLAHCINGLIPFAHEGEMSGKLQIMGQPSEMLDLFERSMKIGTVLQDSDGQFVGLTVAEDLAFALENECVDQPEMEQRVRDVAKLVDIEHRLENRTHQLSGGQKQRVALGGVLIDQVPILLFDEPLANLDPATGHETMELIDRLQRQTGATVIIIEHRLEEVMTIPMDRVVVMRDGEIVADMEPSMLLASPILEQTALREPLYISALKYAGVQLDEQQPLSALGKLRLTDYDEHVRKWFRTEQKQAETFARQPLLTVKNLSFAYGDQPILHDLSFDVYAGEMLSLVGRNGTGKSTLAKLLCALEKPTAGQIVIDGVDVTQETIAARAKRIGFVMQNPNHMISEHIVKDEVALGLKIRGYADEDIEQKMEHALRICGLYPFRNWPISALSYGQRKRVTIASVLALEPNILILDEPTAGQDFKHYSDMMEFLKELNEKGVTIIFITHDMHLMLEYTHRTLVLDGGTIIRADRPEIVLGDENVLTRGRLRQTSLYALADRLQLEEPSTFVRCFIEYERQEGRPWQKC